jgi:hypothetical protein
MLRSNGSLRPGVIWLLVRIGLAVALLFISLLTFYG